MNSLFKDVEPAFADAVVPFEIEGMDIRGRVTRLGLVANTILHRHNYPEPVAKLLGEALALSAMMGSMLKYEGIFTFQTKGDGPVSLLVVDYASTKGADGSLTGSGNLRGYAQFDEQAVAALMTKNGPQPPGLNDLLGKGHLALTIDQGADMDRYQGIVALEGNSLTDCALNYFRTSEQLPTEIKVVAEQVAEADGGTVWRAGAIMIQHLPSTSGQSHLPGHSEETAENWRRASVLMSSLSGPEMCNTGLPLQEALYRLYHEDGVRVYPQAHVQAGCRCGAKRLDLLLTTFPREDLIHMAEGGKISMTCEFCTRTYVFKLEEILPKAD
jgi:molecular chaperone Hsp33